MHHLFMKAATTEIDSEGFDELEKILANVAKEADSSKFL